MLNTSLLDILACPDCGGDLRRQKRPTSESEAETAFVCTKCATNFPIVRSIPRFVTSDNYASNFGFQWNRFRATQLDSNSGVPISRDRFLTQSGWTAADLAGKLVLDVGCGAGRFAEIALSLGARVVAVDYSSAVDACLANLGVNDRLTLLQADLYRLPFKPHAFDYIYCFGVLQHTPDVERAFRSLPRFLRPGGRIAIDVYPKMLRTLFDTHYWIRPLTKRISSERLFKSLERAVPVLLPVSRALGRLPIVGRWLRHAVPVSNYDGVHPLTPTQLREWAVLDTFDMLAPAHDHPQTRAAITRWLRDEGFQQLEVFRMGQWVGRGRKVVANDARDKDV